MTKEDGHTITPFNLSSKQKTEITINHDVNKYYYEEDVKERLRHKR